MEPTDQTIISENSQLYAVACEMVDMAFFLFIRRIKVSLGSLKSTIGKIGSVQFIVHIRIFIGTHKNKQSGKILFSSKNVLFI